MTDFSVRNFTSWSDAVPVCLGFPSLRLLLLSAVLIGSNQRKRLLLLDQANPVDILSQAITGGRHYPRPLAQGSSATAN